VLRIRNVTPSDYTEISVLVVSTFGQPNEHLMIQKLREDGLIAAELVAEADDRIVGHICFSHLEAPQGWWSLAPVTVVNDWQSRGVGGELIRYGLDRARQERARAVVVVGNPRYYRRFGFVFGGKAQISSPYPEQFTGLYPIAAETARAEVALAYPQAFQEV